MKGINVNDSVVWQENDHSFRGIVMQVLTGGRRTRYCVNVLEGDATTTTAIKYTEDLRRVKPTRADRAYLIVKAGLDFLGNKLFSVPSQSSPGKWYTVDINSDHCPCIDHQVGNKCKHLLAAEMWYNKATLKDMVHSLVPTLGKWDGKSILIWSGQNISAYVILLAGSIFLELQRDARKARVVVADANTLTMQFDEARYRSWRFEALKYLYRKT